MLQCCWQILQFKSIYYQEPNIFYQTSSTQMRSYQTQGSSLQEQDIQQHNSLHSYQPQLSHTKKQITIQNIIEYIKNCSQQRIIITISVLIFCVLFINILLFKLSTNSTNNQFIVNSNNTLELLKNTLLYDQNKKQTEIPIMKIGKTHNITLLQIQNAIKYTQIIPAKNSKNPQQKSIYDELSRADSKNLDLKYQIKKYNNKQIPFCIIIPFQQKQILQNKHLIVSIIRQNYRNYKLIWSRDQSISQKQSISALLKQNYQFEMSKSYNIKNSTQNILQNIYLGIKQYCISGQVVILMNKVDFLIGTNILSLYNSAFQQKKALIVYSQYLKINYETLQANLSDFQDINTIYKNTQSFKTIQFQNEFPLISFYTDLFLSIPIQNFFNQKKQFHSEVWQNALLKPLFQLSGSNSYYLSQITFAINLQSDEIIDKSQTDYIKKLQEIKLKSSLQPLSNLNFIFTGQLKKINTNLPKNQLPSANQQKNDLLAQISNEQQKQSVNAESQQNLLKDEEADITISQDQQTKPNNKIQTKQIKNQDKHKKSQILPTKAKIQPKQTQIQQQKKQSLQLKDQGQQNQIKSKSQLTQNDKNKNKQQIFIQGKQKLISNKQKQKQPVRKINILQKTKAQSSKDIELPKQNEEQDLKEPILAKTYQNDRNPLASPTIVKPQPQNIAHKGEQTQIQKTQSDQNQHRPPTQKVKIKKQKQVIIDGKKSIKSTQILPIDQVQGFLQIDEFEEQSQQIIMPKIDKKSQKRLPTIAAGKIDVKGSNYNFNVSIQEMINRADLQKIFGKKKSKQGIWKNQFLQAIQKLQITNNVKYGGQIQLEITKFDSDKFEKKKRIQDLIKTQTEYLESNYKISQYKKKQLPFCIVIPSYQNVQTGLYLRNLNSIFMQDYSNYHIVYIDDASPDKTGEYVKGYAVSRSIPLEKIQIITNKQNRKPPYNIYNAITNHCKLGQLALIVEGDDALIGTNVLNLYNAIYQKNKCAMIYSSYLEIFENSRAQLGVAHQIMDEYFQKNSIRTISQIPGRYLLSFYVDVFKSIQSQQFKDPHGYFFWFAYDRALITPLLEVSYPQISIVKEILYEHRRDTDKKQSLADWNRESGQILAKKPYKPLKFFPFVQRNKYKYFLDKPIDKVIQNSDFDAYTFLNNFQHEGITKQMHIRAIKLTQLIHNVKYGGKIQIQLAEYQTSKEQKYDSLLKLLQQDKKYYNQKYNIDFYRQQELPFCIVTPSYNNVKSGLYFRNLDSLFMQDYENYHVVYIDDCSPDKTGQFVKKYLEQKKIPQKHIEVIINKENKKALYNLHMGIHKYCKSGEIVAIIDGDDSFLGRNVLSLYNAVYQKEKAAMAYSNFLTIHNNDRTQKGFCHEVDKEMFEQNTFRNSWDLPGTHLMTFYSDLFKKIKISDLTYPNGTFYDYAYDRAILTPLLEMAYPRISVIKQLTYEYRNDTGINDAPDDWSRVSHIILDKKPYSHLEEFPFIKGLIVSTDKFNIKAEIQTVIKNTNLTVYETEPNKKITGIAKQQHVHAIRLTELVHNINFQGQVDVSLKITKNAQKKKQRLQKLLKNDKEYLQTKYDISKYKQNELPFCIVVSSHTSVQNGLYLRNLNSILMQDYKNYRIIFIDDNSPEQSQEYINKYLEQQKIPSHVIKIIRNQQTRKQLSNIYFAAHNHCELNEIMLILGENDALIGRNVLSVLNARYHKDKAKVGFSCFLKVYNSSTELGTCANINPYYFKTKTFRNHLQYQKYRLMNFYTYLFRRLKIKDLTYDNGTFFEKAIDKAIMIPIIEMAYPDVVIVKDIMYEDRYDKQSKDFIQQGIQTNIILSKDQYEKVDKIQQFQVI